MLNDKALCVLLSQSCFRISVSVSDWQVYYYLHQWLEARQYKYFYWWFLYCNFNIYWQGFTIVTYPMADYYFAGLFNIKGELSVNVAYFI
jgi:hypothetical protein